MKLVKWVASSIRPCIGLLESFHMVERDGQIKSKDSILVELHSKYLAKANFWKEMFKTIDFTEKRRDSGAYTAYIHM